MDNLGFLPQIDQVIQIGAGIEASILGQGWNVYRVSSTTPATGVLDGIVVASMFGEFEERAQRKVLENQTFELLAIVITIDNRNLILGDFLQQTGYKSDGGVYCFAQYRPPNDSIFVRTEGRFIIRRFRDTSIPAVPKPAGTWQLRTERAQDSEPTADTLTLTAGVFGWGHATDDPEPVPVVVPVGVQPTTRARPGRNEVPSDVTVQRFVGYIPPLGTTPENTVLLRDGDEIENTANPDEVYVLEQVYSSEGIGLVGTVALLSKEGT